MAFKVNHWTLRIAVDPWDAKPKLINEWKRSGQNITKLARRLGISRSSVYSYFRRLGIDHTPVRPQLEPHSVELSPGRYPAAQAG